MKSIHLTLGIASGFFLAACSGSSWGVTHSSVSNSGHPTATADDDDDEDDGDEQDIALSALPDAVKQAALAAVPGFVMKQAEIEKHGDATIYSIDGLADGEECCVEVSPDGTVIAIEHEDDDDGDDD